MKKHIFIIFVFIFVCANLFAGTFRSLNVKEGLSSRQVFQIAKDSVGFIWAYTHMGVDRYDGNEIRHYKLEGTSDSKDHILSSTVMCCDKNGTLWIALKSGKIYTYDKRTDSFGLHIDLFSSLSGLTLHNILFDDNNHLWICTSSGIYSWNEEEGLTLAGLKGKTVYCLVQRDNSVFFAGTNTHLYKLKLDEPNCTFSEEVFPSLVGVHFESLYTSGLNLFIGTFSDGMFSVNLITGKVKSFKDIIPHVPIRAFAQTKDNTLLVGADGAGVFRINIVTGELIEHYVTDEDNERSLNGNTVSDICVDEYNRIWISTSTNGISYLDPDIPDVKWMKHEQNNSNSLIANHTNVILQDSEGDYWYGTNNGVSLYQPKQGKWTHFLNGRGHGAKVVLTLCEDRRGNIWIGGYGIGVYCVQKKTGRIRQMGKKDKSGDKGIATDYIYAMYAEGDNIWLGGIEGDFTRYNIRTDAYTYYPIDCIGDIKPVGDGSSLMLAGCNGLAFFDKSTGKTQWHHEFGNITLRFPVRCLLQSSIGDIWMGTDGDGLIRFNPDTEQAKSYTTSDGLASNSINSLLEDNEGRIWFNTEKELYCMDLTQNIIISANDFLDISWGYYNPNSALKLSDGNLVFGTAEGALLFTPSFNLEQNNTVNLIFTDFKLLYQSVKAGMGSPLEKNINDTQNIRLKYVQNSFSISFSAINFMASHKIRYEYMLENFIDEWKGTNSVQSVNYMDLSPGKYVFRLRAFDKYTGQLLGKRDLDIVINPPYWITGWALLLYAISFSAFIYLLIQFRKHKVNEDRIKERIDSFISIAHDIRTPISLIKAPLSELEMQSDLSDVSKKKVAVAARNVEKLFTMITQLLDLQRTEKYPGSLKVVLVDIKVYMEEKISGFRIAARQKEIDLQLEVEADMPLIWLDREKMDHIIDNLLSNALKYTEKGTIGITVKKASKKWSIEVRDTGIGIPQDEQNNIFHEYYRAKNVVNSQETGVGIGLMITRRLVQQHHGTISFDSVEGVGTTFVVTFPQKIKSAEVIVVETVENGMKTTSRVDTPQKVDCADKDVLLLIEDDKDMREYLTDSLSSEYKVVMAMDGGQGLEMAKEMNPDIIISDIVMPVLQGDELCRMLKSSVDTSHIPIILLTALNERENIILGLEAGATDYIIKPFDLSVLKVRLRNILQSRQHLRETVLSMDTVIEETAYTTQLDKEFLDKVMEVVNTELANSELSINDFCRMLGMSRTSVYNKIKTLTGQGPNDFIRIVRLNKAKELLLSRKYAIGEVSSMVGFSDPKYFSTCFKKQFGISPSKI